MQKSFRSGQGGQEDFLNGGDSQMSAINRSISKKMRWNKQGTISSIEHLQFAMGQAKRPYDTVEASLLYLPKEQRKMKLDNRVKPVRRLSPLT